MKRKSNLIDLFELFHFAPSKFWSELATFLFCYLLYLNSVIHLHNPKFVPVYKEEVKVNEECNWTWTFMLWWLFCFFLVSHFCDWRTSPRNLWRNQSIKFAFANDWQSLDFCYLLHLCDSLPDHSVCTQTCVQRRT